MKRIRFTLLCILLFFTGCSPYTVMPDTDNRPPSASVLPISQARFIYMYNFFSFTVKPTIDKIKGWTKETVVVKEWDGYYYSKHTITQVPELSYYIFYHKEDYSNIPTPMVCYSYFVSPTSSEDVSAIQVGDPYSKLQEQYGFFPDLEGHIEFVHSDGEILFCRIDRIDGELKVVDVRPGLKEEFALMIKEILKFEATLE